jgi:perosamine synthetase
MKRIPVAGPSITDKEIAYVTDAAANGWYEGAGDYNRCFEDAFAAYVGVRHAVSLPSCTSAIHLSLLALGVGPGDEVIVPDATWIASAAPITHVGATPVFADIDPETWCLSAESMEACVTARTKAVIPVELYGSMPDWDAVLAVAEKHGIAVIEDSAEAIGSEYRGRRAGSFGQTGVFSFHGSKTLTTGEGGMLVTDDTALFERTLFLRDHGRPPGDRMFCNTEVAWKYKMSALQAALGLAQLERVEELVARKREIFSWYRNQLAEFPGLTLNAEPEHTRNSYWMSTVLFDAELQLEKADVMEGLSDRGVDSRPFFNPLSSLAAYANCPTTPAAKERNRVAYDLSPRGINLPSALSLTEPDVARVCAAFKEVLKTSQIPAA